jgi:hypothetical protein
MTFNPLHFIGEPVEPIYNQTPLLDKKPGCPDGFIWQGVRYTIVQLISEWHDYRRHGRSARNMKPEHAAVAAQRGSWGVGEDHYCVLTQNGKIFDIYYDRSPGDSDHRKGVWVLNKELVEG